MQCAYSVLIEGMGNRSPRRLSDLLSAHRLIRGKSVSVPLNFGFSFCSRALFPAAPFSPWVRVSATHLQPSPVYSPPPWGIFVPSWVLPTWRTESLEVTSEGCDQWPDRPWLTVLRELLYAIGLCTHSAVQTRGVAAGSTDWPTCTLSREAPSCRNMARAWLQRAIFPVVLHSFPLQASLPSHTTPHIFQSGNHAVLPLNVSSWHLCDTANVDTWKAYRDSSTKKAAPCWLQCHSTLDRCGTSTFSLLRCGHWKAQIRHTFT